MNVETRNARKRERAQTVEFAPLCDNFAQHAVPSDYQELTSYDLGDIRIQRFRCPVCLNVFTVENV